MRHFSPRFSKHALERLVERFPSIVSEAAKNSFRAGDLSVLADEAKSLFHGADGHQRSNKYKNGVAVLNGGVAFVGIPMSSAPHSNGVLIKTVLFREWVM